MKIRLFLTGCLALLFSSQLFASKADWHLEFPAFKIAGNLYYVGTADLAVYLINTPEGNILINSDMPEDLPLIKKGIEQLGFKYADTKILLLSHAHYDHDAAAGIIVRETGAKLMVMDADVPDVESTRDGNPGVKVDKVLHDEEVVELGGSKLVAHKTPGHTKGCTTWAMQVKDGDRTLNAVIAGSSNVNPGYILVGNKDYPGIAEDYAKSFEVLNSLPVDLFLASHAGFFDLKKKYERMKAGEKDAFIDPKGYKNFVSQKQESFLREKKKQDSGIMPTAPAPLVQ